MKLLTKEIEEELLKYGIDGQKELVFHSKVIARFFNPYGIGTWLITGGKRLVDGDWLLFGYVSLIYNEWGYILLSELESLKLGNEIPIIERDRYLRENTTVHNECVRLGIIEFEYG